MSDIDKEFEKMLGEINAMHSDSEHNPKGLDDDLTKALTDMEPISKSIATIAMLHQLEAVTELGPKMASALVMALVESALTGKNMGNYKSKPELNSMLSGLASAYIAVSFVAHAARHGEDAKLERLAKQMSAELLKSTKEVAERINS